MRESWVVTSMHVEGGCLLPDEGEEGKSMDATPPPPNSNSRRKVSPKAVKMARAPLSCPATMYLPSGEKAAARMMEGVLCHSLTRPVSTHHTRSLWSLHPVKNVGD